MKYLLFNYETVEQEINDLTEITNEEFENLAKSDGFIFNNIEDFTSAFNSEHFSTTTHQLRIVGDSELDKAVERLSHYICDDEDQYEDMHGALKLLEAQAEIDGTVMADDIVMMWEKVEFSFTVNQLLDEIN